MSILQVVGNGDSTLTLDNLSPASGAMFVLPSTTITFDVLDVVYDVDPTTISVDVNGTEAYSSQSNQNGYSSTVTRIANGYRFVVTPPSDFGPGVTVTVQVSAKGTFPAIETDTLTYNFTISAISTPYVAYYEPTSLSTDRPLNQIIAVSVGDLNPIVLSTVRVYVNDVVVYNGSTDTFITEYASSIKRANSIHGYEFVLQKTGGWSYGQRIRVRIYAESALGQYVDFSWYFDTILNNGVISVFKMLRSGLRQADQRSPSLLGKLIEDAGGLNDIHKEKVFDRLSAIYDMYDPYKIPAKFLPYMGALVGFTRDMDISASETELREVYARAGALWSVKGSEPSYEIAVQMATTGRYRIQNWFDRRMQADKTYVTEMLLDYDPIALDFDTPNPQGSQFEILGVAGDGYPDDSRFFIADLPTSFFPTGSFTREYEYAYLQILDYPSDPTRVGFHRIEKLKPNSKIGYFSGAWTPAAGYTGDLGTWRLWGMNGEYVTEIRVVDDGSINRSLLKYMIDVVRPNGERVDIVYMDFLDEFKDNKYVAQWTTSGTYTLNGSYIALSAGSSIVTESAASAAWGVERQVSMRLRGESTSTVAIPYLCYVDANNNIRAEIDYGAQTLKVQRINSGVVTQIGSTVSLPALYPTGTWGTDYEYRDVFRFALIETNSGADLLIRVYYGGNLVYEQTYASNPFTVGKIALASTGAKTYTDLIEVLLLPTTQDRVGPNP